MTADQRSVIEMWALGAIGDGSSLEPVNALVQRLMGLASEALEAGDIELNAVYLHAAGDLTDFRMRYQADMQELDELPDSDEDE